LVVVPAKTAGSRGRSRKIEPLADIRRRPVMGRDRAEIIAELRRLATLTDSADRERKLKAIADRLESGEDVDEIEYLPLEPE
jgi:hypothetical protein